MATPSPSKRTSERRFTIGKQCIFEGERAARTRRAPRLVRLSDHIAGNRAGAEQARENPTAAGGSSWRESWLMLVGRDRSAP